MRNSLAEDVLDSKMLFLLKAHKKAITQKGGDGSKLESTIQFLSHTSSEISFFSDKLYIYHINDKRINELDNFWNFMKTWRGCAIDKNFISTKLWFDLQSMCLGFKSIIRIKLAVFPHSVIKPAIINQDCVENHFCQVRSCNGQNNNPTYKLQESCQNTIIYGQKTISSKSNAGKQLPTKITSMPYMTTM